MKVTVLAGARPCYVLYSLLRHRLAVLLTERLFVS
jgi:hypothetical protein